MLLFSIIYVRSSFIDIKPEVLKAIKHNGPVVALESTIITHGMPFPYNVKTAMAVEDIIRKEVIVMSIILSSFLHINIIHLKQNAVPATIAILNGRIKVGLSLDELTLLANCDASTLNVPTISESSSVHGKVSIYA